MHAVSIGFSVVVVAVILLSLWYGGQWHMKEKIKKSGLLSPDHAQSLLKELAADLQECHKASIDFQQTRLNPYAEDSSEESILLREKIREANQAFWGTAGLAYYLGLIQTPKSYKTYLQRDPEAGR